MQVLGLDITDLANATIALLAALVASAAVYVGRRTPKPTPQPAAGVSVEGAAIVSSQAIITLNAELAALRVTTNKLSAKITIEGEKTRKVGYRLAEVSDRLVDELAEVRHEMADLSREMARK